MYVESVKFECCFIFMWNELGGHMNKQGHWHIFENTPWKPCNVHLVPSKCICKCICICTFMYIFVWHVYAWLKVTLHILNCASAICVHFLSFCIAFVFPFLALLCLFVCWYFVVSALTIQERTASGSCGYKSSSFGYACLFGIKYVSFYVHQLVWNVSCPQEPTVGKTMWWISKQTSWEKSLFENVVAGTLTNYIP